MGLNLFAALMPPEERFTGALLRAGAAHPGGRAGAAADDRRGRSTASSHVAAIRAIEMAADAVARKVFIAANRTFNAPIDREDILALAHDLDDAVDLIEDTAKGIQRYDVHEFPAEMRADGRRGSSRLRGVLREVMPYLDSVAQRPQGKIFALCERGRPDRRARPTSPSTARSRDLRAQLRAGEIDTIGYIDRKELYELIENVVDKCDDVANAIQSITAKHV